MRRLIVNADDFGQSAGINRGVAVCHEAGMVGSASLMVRWPAAAAAAAYARRHPKLSVGLHIDLGEWTCQGDEWRPLYQVVDAEDEAAVRDEVSRQLGVFADLLGHSPTHLDSHQHVHQEDVVHRVVLDAAARLGVPLRHYDPRIRYDGRFYGQGHSARPCPEQISVASLTTIIETLPEGISELACHPALGLDLEGAYQSEREMEVVTLCDPRIRAALVANGVELLSFDAVPRAGA